MVVLYDKRIHGFYVRLTKGGELYVGRRRNGLSKYPWYHHPATKKPWLPRVQNFICLIKTMIASGAFDKPPAEPCAALKDL